MKIYTINGIEHSEEETSDWFNCKFCNSNITDADTYLHEDQFGEHFCEDEECLGTHLMECDLVEIEDIDNTGE